MLARSLSLARSLHISISLALTSSWPGSACSRGIAPQALARERCLGPGPTGATLAHNTTSCTMSPVRATQRYRTATVTPRNAHDNSVVRARLLSSAADLRLQGDARAFSPRSPSFSLPLSPSISLSLFPSLSLFSRNCRHGTSYVHIGRPRRGHRFFPSTRKRREARSGTHDTVARNVSHTAPS